MICKICKAEYEDSEYCPMCGAPKNAQMDQDKQSTEFEERYQYGNADPDSTSVLNSKDLELYFGNENKYNEEDRVVFDIAPVAKKKSKKKLIIAMVSVLFVLILCGSISMYLSVQGKKEVLRTAHLYYVSEKGQLQQAGSEEVEVTNFAYLSASNYDYTEFVTLNAETQQLLYVSGGKETLVADKVIEFHVNATLTKVVYSRINQNTLLDLYMWTPTGEIMIDQNLYELTDVNISEGGECVSYTTKNKWNGYEIYSVTQSGEKVVRSVSANILSGEYISDEGALVYFSNEDNKYYYDDFNQKSEFAEAVKAIIIFEKTKQYAYLNKGGNLYVGSFAASNEEATGEMIAANVESLYEVGGKKSCEDPSDNWKLNQIDQRFTSISESPKIFYANNNNNYYMKDLTLKGESEKVISDAKSIERIQFLNASRVTYLQEGALYLSEKKESDWEASLIASNCIDYLTFTSGDMVYRQKTALYGYEIDTSKQTKLADAVSSYNIEKDQSKIVYVTDNKLFYRNKIGGKETAVENKIKVDASINLTDGYIYYSKADGTFVRTATKKIKTETIDKNITNARIVWR